MIEFKSVSKAFGDHVVLDDLSFSVERSERVALIGTSGSGKTTILRMLMTLESPDAGVVSIGGEDLWNVDLHRGWSHRRREAHLRRMRSQVGMVFQQYNLFPNWTALQNIEKTLKYVEKCDEEEARSRATELLGLVGLAPKAEQFPNQLSGGQQQRVAIARALALRPQVMLFDEVTSALDPELVGEVLAVLRDLAFSTEMTMLFVTHEMKFAADIADRVMMFDQGVIVESGPPRQMFSDPTNERTRRFLDSVLRPQ